MKSPSRRPYFWGKSGIWGGGPLDSHDSHQEKGATQDGPTMKGHPPEAGVSGCKVLQKSIPIVSGCIKGWFTDGFRIDLSFRGLNSYGRSKKSQVEIPWQF